jgi:site-specific recombinase XerD
MKTIAFNTQVDSLIEDYRVHLLNAAGLTPATCKCWTFYARQFLRAQFKPRGAGVDCSALNAQSLLDYFRKQSQSYGPPRLQAMGCVLRSLWRFLCLSGRHPEDLSAAIPRIADRGREDLPTYLSVEELERLLREVDPSTPAGKREGAVLLSLARLGLRAGEVAHLTLEDLHWETGTLRLARTKGRRERCLPLPQDVGQAIARYLRQRPHGTTSRRVFLTLYGGRPLSASAVSALSVAALKRAGLTRVRPGAHLLRRTVASHLVQRGASLKAVADWLGHRSLNTTQIYAKVNLPMLQSVASPWPSSEVPS